MAFRISRGVWQFQKPDGSYESKYKLNDSGALVETDTSGNEVAGFSASVAWTAVSGRPTTLSSFTNDLGNYGGWLTTSGKAADANLLDGIDSSGFLRIGGGTLTGNLAVAGALTVNKSGTDSYINFPAQSNDPGYIRHYESSNTARMYFSVSDDNGTNDYFAFGYSGDPDNFRIYSDGSIYSPLGAEFDGRVYADNGLHVRGDWVRVNGTTGIYFESYGGGWHMSDSTWIRSYNSKPIYVDQYVRADQGFEVSGHRVIGNDKNVNAASQVQIGTYVLKHNTTNNRLEFILA